MRQINCSVNLPQSSTNIIESLRDLKKGGAKETLDIKISDAAGIRAYELFSGVKPLELILHSALLFPNYSHAALALHCKHSLLMKDLVHRMKKV